MDRITALSPDLVNGALRRALPSARGSQLDARDPDLVINWNAVIDAAKAMRREMETQASKH